MEFAVYYDVTNKAMKYSEEGLFDTYKFYKAVYVCKDVHSFWVARIQENINKDYRPQKGKYLLERNLIEKEDFIEYLLGENNIGDRNEKISRQRRDYFIDKLPDEKVISTLLKIDIEDRALENWDYIELDSLEECIEAIDGGYGIIAC